jgi:hypothetical protein
MPDHGVPFDTHVILNRSPSWRIMVCPLSRMCPLSLTFMADHGVSFVTHVTLSRFYAVERFSFVVAPEANEATTDFFPQISQKA